MSLKCVIAGSCHSLTQSFLHTVEQLHLVHEALNPVDGLSVLEKHQGWQCLS